MFTNCKGTTVPYIYVTTSIKDYYIVQINCLVAQLGRKKFNFFKLQSVEIHLIKNIGRDNELSYPKK